ncbi:hypothetical protein VIBNISFn118_630002 [Vibrio nigripulchritudo SFn118]|nr:hypothetical protein VIBNISFn118_630002 [Vibrio nigripulchritudo SFn118]
MDAAANDELSLSYLPYIERDV